MATKALVARLVEDWLSFSARRPNPEEITNLSKSYLLAFTGFKDRDIVEAADIYRVEGEYFPPRPRQILDLVKGRQQNKHDQELRKMWICKVCGLKASAISEGICLNCRGVPEPSYKNIFLPNPDQREYKISEMPMRCQSCGNIGRAIKEPPDTGQWLCHKCYSGVDGKEIHKRWADLAKVMDGTGFIPDWAERTPF